VLFINLKGSPVCKHDACRVKSGIEQEISQSLVASRGGAFESPLSRRRYPQTDAL
jgi:hypothetical protein